MKAIILILTLSTIITATTQAEYAHGFDDQGYPKGSFRDTCAYIEYDSFWDTLTATCPRASAGTGGGARITTLVAISLCDDIVNCDGKLYCNKCPATETSEE